MSGRCLCCSSAPASGRRRGSSCSRCSRSSPARWRPAAPALPATGSRSASVATTPAPFCIVPSLRGKEEDRRPGDVLREVEVLARQGVLEIPPLGQNVNSYGRSFGDRAAFGKLLRAVDAGARDRTRPLHQPALARLHRDVVTAMAETPTVCPSLHMPLQSSSDDVLRAMRRSHHSERFLAIPSRVRDQIPDAAITTDIIVGFPTETEADFAETLRVVEASRSHVRLSPSLRPRRVAPTR